jgi:L-amino acid N-acyltransferase YncA
MTIDVTIRHATDADLPAIIDIYNDAVRTTTATFDTEPKSLEDRRAWFAAHDDRHPVLVAECDGRIIGWSSLSRWSDRKAYAGTAETTVYVAADSRGHGIGRRLKEVIINEARRLGFHTLIARVAQESLASLHLNESVGFRRVGTLKEVGRKFGRLLDVHILQLMLNESPDNGSSSGSATVT